MEIHMISGKEMLMEPGEMRFTYPGVFQKKDRKRESQAQTDRKINALVEAMTADEKLDLLHGGKNPENMGKVANAGYLRGVPRLGIPELRMFDGPAGVTSVYETTGLPVQQMLASTWSRELSYLFGAVMGRENMSVSGNCQLGAQFDIARTPQFYRSKDMLGEDSFLIAALASEQTRGITDRGVIATAKHFAGYTQNTPPYYSPDFEVDEQTLHEMYLPGYEMAVISGTGAVMNSYNKLNGDWTANSDWLLKDILRNQLHFKGFVMSDWGANHDQSLHHGIDMEMPLGEHNGNTQLKAAIDRGELSWADVDAAVRSVLYGMATAGLLSLTRLNANGTVRAEENRVRPIRMDNTYLEDVKNGLLETNAAAALDIAEKGAVLLKNRDRALPVRPDDYLNGKTVAIIGLGAFNPITGEDMERSFGVLGKMKSPFDEMKRLAGKGADIQAAVGVDIVGEPIPIDALFQDQKCTNPGLVRSFGISKEDGYIGSIFGGQAGMEYRVPKDDQINEYNVSAAEDMEGHRTGEFSTVDRLINFTCGMKDGEINKTYKNADGGTAFLIGESYTWKGFLKVPENGEYRLMLDAIGGLANFIIELDGKKILAGNAVCREGAQWPWSSIIPTPEGMGISGCLLTLEKDKAYPVSVCAKACFQEKDLQLRCAWITPEMKKRDFEAAVRLAGLSDKVIFFAWRKSGAEKTDFERMTFELLPMSLDKDQTALLKAVNKAVKSRGGKLIVVLHSGTVVQLGSWVHDADAILNMWLPGQMGGTAAAKLLLGHVNPGGKTAMSMPAADRDTWLTDTPEHEKERHDGIVNEKGEKTVRYSEGIFFGYRWYDKERVNPLFEFGFGLSYTSFAYTNLSIKRIDRFYEIGVDVTNTGDIAGAEIVQVYLGKARVPEGVQSAEKQLAGFLRLDHLKPGETRRAQIYVPDRTLCFWDKNAPLTERDDGTKDKWSIAKGERLLYVGASSRDIRLTGKIVV
jgi:beta-glucosidase